VIAHRGERSGSAPALLARSWLPWATALNRAYGSSATFRANTLDVASEEVLYRAVGGKLFVAGETGIKVLF
jgi:hypothetical protein